MRLIVVVLAVTAFASACVPVHVAGYEPSGIGDRETLGCLKGVDNLLRTEMLAGVVRETWANAVHYKREVGLNNRLVIPKGVTVRMLSREFIVESPEWDKPKVLKVQSINGDALMNTLEGASGNAGIFDLWFSDRPGVTGLPEVTVFTLKSPLLAINDQTYQPPDVTFRSAAKWGVALCVQ